MSAENQAGSQRNDHYRDVSNCACRGDRGGDQGQSLLLAAGGMRLEQRLSRRYPLRTFEACDLTDAQRRPRAWTSRLKRSLTADVQL